MTTDFRRLWSDSSTPNRERKRMLAYVIEDATLVKLPRDRTTKVHVRFKGGQTASLGGRIVLHFLSPYCPDANRIERVWQDFHANVTRNHRCTTLKKLLSNARRYLEAYVWRRFTGTRAALRAAA